MQNACVSSVLSQMCHKALSPQWDGCWASGGSGVSPGVAWRLSLPCASQIWLMRWLFGAGRRQGREEAMGGQPCGWGNLGSGEETGSDVPPAQHWGPALTGAGQHRHFLLLLCHKHALCYIHDTFSQRHANTTANRALKIGLLCPPTYLVVGHIVFNGASRQGTVYRIFSGKGGSWQRFSILLWHLVK